MKNTVAGVALGFFVIGCSLACSSSNDNTGDAAPDAGGSDGAKASDTAAPPSCSTLVCPQYVCTCADGSSIQAGGCTDGVCHTGDQECSDACSGSGGLVSFKPVPPAPDAGSPDGAPTCGKLGDACGDCIATNCCPEGAACADDKACQSVAVCVAGCTGSWDKCATQCNTSGNASFTAYSRCIVAKGCAPICKP